jgi:phage-related protein
METVTGFSASLLQSLGGDTAKAAGIADMAIIDMADNANKFGTSMDSIQNAYQGFAKQNYTMLDNLKLGYGGTKEEMERLLTDAAKLSGVTYSIDSLSDVYNAIHVIQEDLGVTGTTAKEAAETFSGSFAAMKASAQNLLGNLAIGGDVTSSMEQLVDSAATFVAGNLIPMVINIFTGLPDAIRVGMSSAAPRIKEALKQALPPSLFDFGSSLFSSFQNVIGLVSPVITQIKEMFERVAPVIANTLGDAFGNSGGFIETFVGLISASIPTVEAIITGLAEAFSYVMPVVSSLGQMFADVFPSILSVVQAVIPAVNPIIQKLAGIFQKIIPVITQIIQTFASVIQTIFPIISDVIVMVLDAVNPIIEAFSGLIQQSLPIIQDLITQVAGVIQQVFPVVSELFTQISSAIATAITAVMPIIQALANLIQAAMPVVQNIITVVAGVIAQVMPTISQIFTEVGSKIAEVINTVVVPVMGVSPIITSAIQIIADIFSSAWDIVSPIIDLAMTVFNALWSVVEAVFPAIQSCIETVWGVLEPIFGAISSGISMIGDAISTVGGWIGGAIDTVGGWFGFAYGKDRVPYNNYPAVLHEGEKVLTRNQADQYDRVMSTRGVELAPTVKTLEPETTSTQPIGDVQEVQEVKQENKGSNINIEKLADTVVIQKEADVDKVVQDMVTKFRKLVPNMP